MKVGIPKTKILVTIGPASWDEHTIFKMVKMGVRLFRLNMSHGDFSMADKVVKRIRRSANKLGIGVAIILDLPGPKMRIGKFDGEIEVRKGQNVVFFYEGNYPSHRKDGVVYIPHQILELDKMVNRGMVIYVGDGLLQFKILSVENGLICCKALLSGVVRSHKGLNIPGMCMKGGAVTDYDAECIRFAVEHKIDAVCVSFVGGPEDILKAKEILPKAGAPIVIAKIERAQAVRRFDEILEVCDAVMVARGDLGVEMPIEEIPVIQKKIVYQANLSAKPVIVATQMLESMVDNLRPTRAEVTDVANAILDGADAVMFSEETAVGRYPLEVIKMAMRIAKTTERTLVRPGHMAEAVRNMLRNSDRIDDMISVATYDILCNKGVDVVVTPTSSGATARRIARLRPKQWIIAVTDDYSVRNILNLSFGVYPLYMRRLSVVGSELVRFLEAEGIVKNGDRIVITSGMPFGVPGTTNSLKVTDV